MRLHVESPEKKKSKTNDSSPPSLPLFSSRSSFSLLPDEIALNCLARISRSNYTRLSLVSKSLRSLLSSTELYAERSRLGNTEQCLYVCPQNPSYEFAQWYMLWVNPNKTLPNLKKEAIRHLLVPILSFTFTSVSNSVVPVGSEIYVISRARVRVFDCRTHTWRNAPSMNVARGRAYSCVYDGKIYVMGGIGRGLEEDEPWAEVFDTKTQTWECLPDPGPEIRQIGIHRIVEIDGKIKFGSLYKMYAYDTKQGKWEHYENEIGRFGRSYCVMENVSFSSGYNSTDGPIKCYWSDVKDENWKEVKGLDSLGQKHMRSGGSSSNTTKVVSFDRKLLLIWEVYMYPNPNDMKRIWCAEIVVEKRDGGEVWGNVEWVDVVLTVPTSCYLLHCLEVCV